MPSTDLVTIASFGSNHEASLAQSVLGGEGIKSYLTGAETANALWYYGSCIGGIKLQVARIDARRATRLLKEIRSQEQSESIPSWVCPDCGNENENGFEICWACGSPYIQDSTPEEAKLGDNLDSRPISDSSSDGKGPMEASYSEELDDLVARAWRSAIYGLAFAPLLLYSLYLIIKICHKMTLHDLTQVSVHRFWLTVAFLFFMFVLTWSTAIFFFGLIPNY